MIISGDLVYSMFLHIYSCIGTSVGVGVSDQDRKVFSSLHCSVTTKQSWKYYTVLKCDVYKKKKIRYTTNLNKNLNVKED